MNRQKLSVSEFAKTIREGGELSAREQYLKVDTTQGIEVSLPLGGKRSSRASGKLLPCPQTMILRHYRTGRTVLSYPKRATANCCQQKLFGSPERRSKDKSRIDQSSDSRLAPIMRFPSIRRLSILMIVCLSGCEQPSVEDTPPIATELQEPRMNCLVLVLDSFHATKSSLYGYPKRTTPYLDTWAQQGIVFENVTSQFTSTSNSAWSYLNGKYPYTSGSIAPMRDIDRPIAEVFRNGGYRSGAFSDNPFISEHFRTNKGFTHFQYHEFSDHTLSDRNLEIAASRSEQPKLIHNQMTKHLFDELEGWIRDGGDEPWFGYLHTLRPHFPYTPPEPYIRKFMNPEEIPEGHEITKFFETFEKELVETYLQDFRLPSARNLQILHDLYLANILYIDDLLNDFLVSLHETQLLDNTLVIITSDHGEAFGEHGIIMHGGVPYREVTHVPLVFLFPASMYMEPGSIPKPVSLVDLFKTLTELYDLKDDFRRDGQSLVPLLRGLETSRDSTLFTQSRLDLAVIHNQQKLIRAIDDDAKIVNESYRVFDLNTDPEEKINLHPNSVSERLSALANQYLEAQMTNAPMQLDTLPEEDIEIMEALGYIQ